MTGGIKIYLVGWQRSSVSILIGYIEQFWLEKHPFHSQINPYCFLYIFIWNTVPETGGLRIQAGTVAYNLGWFNMAWLSSVKIHFSPTQFAINWISKINEVFLRW